MWEFFLFVYVCPHLYVSIGVYNSTCQHGGFEETACPGVR